jgi:uncharacterized repeat protein (TIGR02543 family)
VGFDKNGGDTEAAPPTKTVSSPETTIGALPETPPTRDGYDFAGWNTRADGLGSAFTASTTVTDSITVYAQWNPGVSLTVTLQPEPVDPSISYDLTELYEDEAAAFSVAAEYATYQWYWNGTPIPGATAAEYTLAANSKLPGIHELSVKVTTGNSMLSARHKIVIKAR